MDFYSAHYSKDIVRSCANLTHSLEDDSQNQKNSQFKWIELLGILQQNEPLTQILVRNTPHLFVSKTRLLKQKKLDPTFLRLIEEFDPQNCLKAISVLKDLTSLKQNQYKFLFQGLNLGHSVRLLIRESFYLNRTIKSTSQSSSHFKRLISGWIQFVCYVHKVPKDAAIKLEDLIFEHICLRLKSGILPCSFLINKK